MNGYLLTLIVVLIAFVVIALARMLASHKLPHPHDLSAGNDGQGADADRDPRRGDENRR